MQTPLITNFSRGILSPKFFGRVDSELYHAGVAELRDFVVNNQGSVQRRRGTYRIWNTRVTAPAPTGQETDRFEVGYTPGQQYTLTVMSDDSTQAQLILSTAGEHRFFQLVEGEDETGIASGGLTLGTEIVNVGGTDILYPIAHSFALDEVGQIVDDSFLSTFGNITFLRLRSSTGRSNYRTKVWHKTISPGIAALEAATPPFVEVAPLPPPTYDNKASKLTENIGYTVLIEGEDPEEEIIHTGEVAQFVGQTVSGLSSVITQSAYLKRGALDNAAQDSNLLDTIELTIPTPKPAGGIVGNIPGQGTLGEWRWFRSYPGRSAVYFSNIKLEENVVVQTTRSTRKVLLDFREVVKMVSPPFTLWGFGSKYKDWDKFYAQYHAERKYCRNGLFGVCFKDGYDHHYARVKVNFSFPFNLLRDNDYDPQETIGWSGSKNDYDLYYEAANGQKTKIQKSKWDVQAHAAGNITKIRIYNELWINPRDGRLPDVNAKYFLQRKPFVPDIDVVGRRAKPYVYNEPADSNVLEHVSNVVEWTKYSQEAIDDSRTVLMHSKRTLLNVDQTLRFRVSRLRDYTNFSAGDSEIDAYDLTVETEKAERMQWAVSVRDGVVVGTDKNEYVLLGTDSPSAVSVRRFTSIGSARPYAIRFGDKILFISRDAKRIMAYSYSDEMSAWYSSDVTSVAQHLFKDGIQSMTYMADPVSAIWVVPEGNNGLYCLSWEPSTGVMAWSQHFDGVNVLAVTTVTVNEKTTLVMAVERGGVVVIEGLDMSDDLVNDVDSYADSAEYLRFVWDEGRPDTEITGPDGQFMNGTNYTVDLSTHRWARFQNQQMVFYIENDVEKVVVDPAENHDSKTYTIGPYDGADVQIEMTAGSGRVVTIGLPYKSRLKTLPILVQSPTGAGVFKKTQVRKMRMRVDQSRSFLVGNDLSDMTQVDLAEADNLIQDEGTGHYTGDVEVDIQSRWMKRPEVYVESYYGDPLTLLAMMVDTQVYE